MRQDTTNLFLTFADAAKRLCQDLKKAPLVTTERWQGVERNQKTRELLNVDFSVVLQGIEDLDHWRADVRPSLPWADDHFEQERVGGKCLNPGEQWQHWPWGNSANRFRGKQELGPRFAPQDWAYLAGMIDGDGTIDPRWSKLPTYQGRISVGQKDRAVLDYLQGLFKVGLVTQMPPRNAVLNGKIYSEPTHMWTVYGSANTRWIATNCLPYLRVKRAKAEEMIRALDEGDKLQGSPKSHRDTVWGREWPARFNHSYADRLWPKRLEGGSDFVGQHWTYGDLNDFVDLLVKYPNTRQAWIPLFFPEDTGIADDARKMCSLGYQVIVRGGQSHIWYPLRSCDFVRHWRDDCYLAVRLLLWVTDQCRLRSEAWRNIVPGTYSMHMTSLHIFEGDQV